MGIIFVFLGILVCFSSNNDSKRYEHIKLTHTQRAQAYVVEVDTYKSKKDNRTYYNVVWGFDVNNEHYEIISYKTFKANKDSTATVLYMPDDPDDNYLEYELTEYQNGGSSFFSTLIIIIGIFLCISGLGIFKFKK